jgi:excisionase family DNA binding protein
MPGRHDYEQLTLPDMDVLLTKRQAAELLNVEERFITRCVFEKRIAYVKVGRHVRIPVSAIRSFVCANTIEPPDCRSRC